MVFFYIFASRHSYTCICYISPKHLNNKNAFIRTPEKRRLHKSHYDYIYNDGRPLLKICQAKSKWNLPIKENLLLLGLWFKLALDCACCWLVSQLVLCSLGLLPVLLYFILLLLFLLFGFSTNIWQFRRYYVFNNNNHLPVCLQIKESN